MPTPNADLADLLALWMGGALLLVPLSSLWLRYGVRPALDALARVRQAAAAPQIAELQARHAGLQAELRVLKGRMERLADEVEGGREPWRQAR